MLPVEHSEDDSRRDNRRDSLGSDLLMPISSEVLIFMGDNISRVRLNQF